MLPREFGSFRIVDTLGVGGSAKVFRGVDPHSGQTVAIKAANHDPAAQVAMGREVAILRRLADAHVGGVPRFLSSGEAPSGIWYAMELVVGPTLQDYLTLRKARDPSHASGELTQTVDVTRRVALSEDNTTVQRSLSPSPAVWTPRPPPYTLSRALELVSKIASTLHEVHLQNVVHGDLSPANVLLRSPDDPVLIDFGAGAAALQPDLFRELSGADRSFRGTPGYVAPEIILGNGCDARCDIYSLGCILYELLTGIRPFPAASAEEVLHQHLHATVRTPSHQVASVPRAVDALVLRMLERDPHHRTSHSWDVVLQIGECLGKPTSPSERFAAPLYRPGFAGRESDLEKLESSLLAARRGSGSLIVISGPSGIGKTRLSNELAARATRAGTLVVHAQCRPQRSKPDGNVSALGYDVFRPVITLYLSAAGHQVVVDTQLLEPLASYAPDLLREITASEQTSTVGADGIAAANEALSRILVALANSRGLLLQIDDVQWIDELSAAFLGERADALRNSGVLVVATERSEEASPLSKQVRQRAHSVVELGPLGPESIRVIAKDMLATETLPEGLLDLLTLQAEGNPLFVAESLRAIAARGQLRRRSTRDWTLDTLGNAASPMASSLLEMLRQLLARLGEQAYEILQLAAILGHEFEIDALATLCDSRVALTTALEELVAGDILVRLPGERFGFRHDKLREATELSMSETSRRLMHERAARYIEARMDRWTDAAAVGCHWAGAHQPAKALSFLHQAARAAHRTYALQRADELYRMAIEQCHALQGGPGENHSLLADLHEARGDVLVAQARHQSAQALYREAHDLLPTGSHLARARTLRKLALSLLTQHDYERAGVALKAAEEALHRLGSAARHQEWQELIQILIGRFEKLYFHQQLGSEIDAIAAQVTQLVETYGSIQQRAAYCNLRTSHTFLRGRFGYVPKAIELARQGVRQSQGLSPRLIATAQFLLGWTLIPGSREQRQEATSHLEHALAGARKAQQRTLVSRILAYHCIAVRRLGLVEETQERATRARAAAEDAQQKPYIGAALACLAWVDWKRENPQAGAGFARALELWKGPHPFPFQWLATLPLLVIASYHDDFVAAAEYLDHLLRTDQQALPAPLEDSIRTAQEALEDGSPRTRSEALTRVVRLARDSDFL